MNPDEENSLAIIGNGFDLSLGIKSSYTDFLNFLLSSHNLETTEEIYNFNKLFVQNFDGKSLNWCDFESIFEKQIIEVNQSTNSKELGYTKEFLINQINQDLKELEILFSEYLEKEFELWQRNWLKVKVDKGKKTNSFYNKLFEKVNTVISFNYTDSVENIFPQVKPHHIHGRLEDGNIIFGGGFSGSSMLDDTSVKGSTENDKLIRSKKSPKITEQRNRIFKKIVNKTFSSIFILGHSIIGSDFIFLKPLFEKSNKIYIFYYEQDYEEKFQFLVQNLEKSIVEKIELVPFFEVIVRIDNIVISRREEEEKEKDDYTAVSDSFDFPIPTDDSNTFLNFEISTKSFLVRSLKNLVINTTSSLKAIYNLLSKLPEEYVENISDDYFNIKIKAKGEQHLKREDISALFGLPLFQKILEKAKTFELSNCDVYLIDLNKLLDINDLKRVKIESNNILFSDKIDNTFDISKLSNVEKINISYNEFAEEIKVNEQNAKKLPYPILLTTVAMKSKILEIQNNTNLAISTDIFEYFKEQREIIISIDSVGEEILELPHIERLKLSVDNSNMIQPLPKLKINSKIKELSFEYFKINEKGNDHKKQSYKPLYLSTLFGNDGRKVILENIEILEFANCEIPGEVVVDCFVNIFGKEDSPKIKTDKEFLFRDLVLEPTRKFDSFIGTLLSDKLEINKEPLNEGKEQKQEYDEHETKSNRVKKEENIIYKRNIHSSLEEIFSKAPEVVMDLDLDGSKKEIIEKIILRVSEILEISDKHLQDSFKSYKYNRDSIPYISEIVDSLSIFGEEFVEHYEKFVNGTVKFRNRVVIVGQIWREVLDKVLIPIEGGLSLIHI